MRRVVAVSYAVLDHSEGILMRRSVAAVTIGLLLVADQAAAAGSTTVVARVGDSVGALADASNEFAGIPLPILFIGGAIMAAAIVVATDDDFDSN